MKYIITSLFILIFFFLFGCNNSKKTLICKNEVKAISHKKFKKPYSYQKLSPKKIEKLQVKTTDSSIKPEYKIEKKEENEQVFASANNEVTITNTIIKERIKKYDLSKDYSHYKNKKQGGSVIKFLIALMLTTILLFFALTGMFLYAIDSGGTQAEIIFGLIAISIFTIYYIIKLWIWIYSF